MVTYCRARVALRQAWNYNRGCGGRFSNVYERTGSRQFKAHIFNRIALPSGLFWPTPQRSLTGFPWVLFPFKIQKSSITINNITKQSIAEPPRRLIEFSSLLFPFKMMKSSKTITRIPETSTGGFSKRWNEAPICSSYGILSHSCAQHMTHPAATSQAGACTLATLSYSW